MRHKRTLVAFLFLCAGFTFMIWATNLSKPKVVKGTITLVDELEESSASEESPTGLQELEDGPALPLAGNDATYGGAKVLFLIITDQDSFAREWQKYLRKKPMPRVDFTNNLVAMVFSGEQRTTGHWVHIDSVEMSQNKTNIVAAFDEPNPLANEGRPGIVSPYAVTEFNRAHIQDVKNHYFFLFVKKTSYPVFVADVITNQSP